MKVEDVVSCGDKVDITFLHQDIDKIYKSSVFDVLSEDEFEIWMPTEGGRMVLFPVGISFHFCFYTKPGLYVCDAIVTNRYKRDGFYLLSVKLESPLKKFQRRDFFRIECSEKFSFYSIEKEVFELKKTEEIFEVISSVEYIDKKRSAIARDISGGGIRFTTEEELAVGSYILIVIRLCDGKMDQTLYLPTVIVDCESVERFSKQYIIRAKFQFTNLKDRESIVRYVFEQDRCFRKRENQ